ncbi:MAG: NAD-dependent epimerase/dehydratase family protein [Candidatus Desulfaltia sp.]|nr:NAD-dependent epimerase/dehydratase family protein [Candidatus Desulfaltia sp.]
MNILITGANGFIGQALCKRMLSDGYQVRGAVRSAAQMTVMPSGRTWIGDVGQGRTGGQKSEGRGHML